MSNERLQAGTVQAGLTPEELADHVGVDAKTIERWISGRVPHRRNRIRLARALATTPTELWPDQDPAPAPREVPSEADGEELVATYLGWGDPALPDPQELMAEASERIELLGLSLGEIVDAQSVAVLGERADSGARVRVLVADPDSVHVLTEQHEHRPDVVRSQMAAVWEIEQTLGYLQPLISHPRVEVRLFTVARPAAILRVDDRMLVRLHLWGASPEQEPVLELEHRDDNGLFQRFTHHVKLIATHASVPAPADPAVYPDPDRHPDRYRPQPPGLDRPLAHAFSATPPAREEDQEPGEATSPSSAPRSSWRRRR